MTRLPLRLLIGLISLLFIAAPLIAQKPASRFRIIPGPKPGGGTVKITVGGTNNKVEAEREIQNTFGAVAAEVLANKQAMEAADATLNKNRWLLENLAAPLKERPIAEITSKEILELLKRVEATGRRESARRLRGCIGSVFRYAIVTLRATSDPTLAIHGALLPPKVKHRPRLPVQETDL